MSMSREVVSGKIRILPESIASRIAAGEVVERPASVVKELIDNSLDAGSTTIMVEVQDGGKRLIQVTDDGEGMTRTDAQVACVRFATSKLSTEEDLQAITSFGFRGEALPSIAAVSKFRLVTARREDMVGTQVIADGGTVRAVEECAAAPGTLVEVRDLFWNTPGRQKFLKSTATEFSHICHVVQQAALAREETHFRLTHNQQLVLEYPRALTKRDRLLQVYGQGWLEHMLFVRGEQGGCRVEGAVVSPHQAKTTRVPQEIFVNGRPVKNATVSHAVYEAYASFLPKGRHPVFVLFVEVEPALVDVNVHPAKREVKFARAEQVHALVKQAVRLRLRPSAPEYESLPHQEGFSSSDHSTTKPIGAVAPVAQSTAEQRRTSEPCEDPVRTGELVSPLPRSWEASGVRHPSLQTGETVSESVSLYPEPDVETITVLGQVNKTFLVAQIGAEFLILDQHTLHERVLFERMWRAYHTHTIPVQPLLLPDPVEVPRHAAVVLNEHMGTLADLGVEVEPFGEAAFVIRAIPAMLGQIDHQALVQDLLDDLANWHSRHSFEERLRPIVASLACRGAVQAGRSMSVEESRVILEDWLHEGRPLTCPHGRRVALRFSPDELNRIFGRG
ncbi:MAG: DNA mismatch repair endonuclease MutL [Nitrospirae bacterium]|nr:MAG: DNA mismatch repair endonuclease MutL [Nitrospirota bacterium]